MKSLSGSCLTLALMLLWLACMAPAAGAQEEAATPAPAGDIKQTKIYQDAVNGEAHAEALLGSAYLLGLTVEGVTLPVDYDQADVWLRKAAARNNPIAQFSLGIMYLKGYKYEKDYREALRLLGLAADQNHLDALKVLGILYFEGAIVPQDYRKARDYFYLAADYDDPTSQEYLGFIYLRQGYFKLAADWFYRAGQNYLKQNNVDRARFMIEQLDTFALGIPLANELIQEISQRTDTERK